MEMSERAHALQDNASQFEMSAGKLNYRNVEEEAGEKRVKGPSTRVRIRVRFRVRFHSRFASKTDRNPILHLTPITMVCLHISEKTNQKFTCETPLAANCSLNRTPIRMQNRTCRRPLKENTFSVFNIIILLCC
jgi:hypothetical protein